MTESTFRIPSRNLFFSWPPNWSAPKGTQRRRCIHVTSWGFLQVIFITSNRNNLIVSHLGYDLSLHEHTQTHSGWTRSVSATSEAGRSPATRNGKNNPIHLKLCRIPGNREVGYFLWVIATTAVGRSSVVQTDAPSACGSVIVENNQNFLK